MLEAHKLLSEDEKPFTHTIALTFDERQKSRHKARTSCGKELGWFIKRGYVLQDGDLLVCASGEVVKVIAALESVSTVYALLTAQNPLLDLTRAAYHLGNRHVPLQIQAGYLRYQHDHVLDEMIVGLGLIVQCDQMPFNPEPGAYSGGHSHDHHESANTHSHVHNHSHSRIHGHHSH